MMTLIKSGGAKKKRNLLNLDGVFAISADALM